MINEESTYPIGGRQFVDYKDRLHLEIYCVILDKYTTYRRTFYHKRKLLKNPIKRWWINLLSPFRHLQPEKKLAIYLVAFLFFLIIWIIMSLIYCYYHNCIPIIIYSGFLLSCVYIPFQKIKVLYNRFRFYKVDFSNDSAHFMNRQMFEYKSISSVWKKLKLLILFLKAPKIPYYPKRSELSFINEIVNSFGYVSRKFSSDIVKSKYYIKEGNSYFCL